MIERNRDHHPSPGEGPTSSAPRAATDVGGTDDGTDAAGSEPCPACGTDVALPSGVVLGEVLFCDHCGAELEVISVDPLRVDLFEEEEK